MAGYTRQSSFADGDTITAALFNNEYNQLVNAFHNSTGHTHDGTAASGPVIGLIGDAGETSPNNKVLIDTTNNHIEFYVEVSSSSVQQLYIADGAIVPVTDSDVDIGTTSLRFKDAFIDSITTTGNVDVGGNLTVTGTTTFNGGTLTLGDADTDNIVFGGEVDSNIVPDDDNTYDLGSSSKEWKDLYIDGVAYLDAINFNGTAITSTAAELNILDGVTSTAAELNILDGVTATTAELNIMDGVTATTAELNILDGVTSTATEINLLDGSTANTVVNSKAVIYGSSGELAGTLSTAAQTNITTVGTLTTLTVDDITINGSTISDGGALSITSGGDFTVDSEDDIILDANGADIRFKDNGTGIGTFSNSSSDFVITSEVQDKDIIFKGNDNGSSITALTLDMSEAGAATFNNKIIATELDISGDVDIDGTLEADAITVNGTTLAETISDTVGAMVTSNTETGITVSYDDSDNTLDFVIGTLNQDTTGNAATATALETARTIHGVSFDGTANIDLSEVIQDTVGAMVSSNTESGITVAYEDSDGTLDFTVGTLNQDTTGNAATATALETARTIHGVSFDGTANIDLTEVVQDTVGAMFSSNTESGITVDYQDSDGTIDLTVGTLNQNTTGSAATLTTARTIGGVSFDGSANIVPTTFNAATFSGDVNVDSGVLFVDVSENKIGVNETSPTVSVDLGSNTDAILLPKGTTAQRPTAEAGQFRYNTTTGEFEGYTDAWGAIAGSGGGTAPSLDTMTGDGSDTTLTLSTSPINENATFVTIDGVLQHKDTYSISGNTLTFSEAPPSGAKVESITLTTTSSTTANILSDADADTKIQVEESSDEDKIRFDTGGTERVVIDSTGVGIGVSSNNLNANLHVGLNNATGDATNPAFQIGGSSSGNTYRLGLYTSTEGGVIENKNGDDGIQFRVKTAGEAMRIDGGTGNVGIGTTSPSRQLTVQKSSDHAVIGAVSGTSSLAGMVMGDTSDDDRGAVLYNNNGDFMYFQTDTSERMRITSSGDVGIGTTSPQSALHIAEGGSGSDGGSVLTLSQTGFGTIVNNDDLGSVHFGGVTSGGVGSHACAKIMVEGDGTFGTNDFPTRMGFFTTADGGNTLSENMRLTNAGLLQLGTSIGNSTYAGLFNGVSNVGTGAIIQTRNGDGKKQFMLRGDNNVEYGSIGLSSATGTASLQIQGEHSIVFNTNTDSERMSILSNGVVLIGTSTQSGISNSSTNHGVSIGGGGQYVVNTDNDTNFIVNRSNGTGTHIQFRSDGGNTGTINTNGSAVSFNTGSDYRLKENVIPLKNGLDRVNKLKPVQFDWKKSQETDEGFIAHEAQEIVPYVVKGEKDGEEIQTMDYAKLTPLLVKAIQEQQEQINALQSEIKNLKGE